MSANVVYYFFSLLTGITYNIKEALTGVDGVQQLINVVLSHQQTCKDNRRTCTKFQHALFFWDFLTPFYFNSAAAK